MDPRLRHAGMTQGKYMPDVTLYYKPTCPYCQKVLAYMDQNGINLRLKDVLASPENKQELIKIGGKGQVPCLVTDGKALYESDDIIKWLGKNWKN